MDDWARSRGLAGPNRWTAESSSGGGFSAPRSLSTGLGWEKAQTDASFSEASMSRNGRSGANSVNEDGSLKIPAPRKYTHSSHTRSSESGEMNGPLALSLELREEETIQRQQAMGENKSFAPSPYHRFFSPAALPSPPRVPLPSYKNLNTPEDMNASPPMMAEIPGQRYEAMKRRLDEARGRLAQLHVERDHWQSQVC